MNDQPTPAPDRFAYYGASSHTPLLSSTGGPSFDEACRYQSQQNSVRKLRLGKDFGRRRRKPIGSEEYRRVYLFLYNLFQLVGFIYLLVVLSIRYAKDGSSKKLSSCVLKTHSSHSHSLIRASHAYTKRSESTESSYRALGLVIKSLYVLQLLELINIVVGLTRRSLVFNGLQVIWRLFFIVVIIDDQPRMHTEHLTFHLLLVYTLLELLRLPYYCLRIFRVDVRLFGRVQANGRFLLQPVSMLLEATLLYKSLPLFEHSGNYSLLLPNALNISFHLPTFIRLYLLLGLFPCKYSN